MAITYSPNSFIKKFQSPIERIQERSEIFSVTGHANLATGFSYTFNPGSSCEILEVQLAFGSSASKSYAISKALGVGIVTGLNDVLWIQSDGVPAQSVVIPAGFYNGTALATALQSALNGVTNFTAIKPFAVSYTAATGLFLITPNAGTIQFWIVNPGAPVFSRTSTAGPSLGFTVNATAASSLSSNAPVYGLTVVNDLVSETSTSQSIVSTDVWALDFDQGLRISTSAVGTTLDYKIVYKVL